MTVAPGAFLALLFAALLAPVAPLAAAARRDRCGARRMSLITCAARPGVCARTRIVMLPAAFSTPQDFVQAGFVEAVRAAPPGRRPGVCRACARARDRPRHPRPACARSSSCRRAALGCTLWLGGISLGAYLALCGAELCQAQLAGLCLFAPYLGSHLVTAEIERAGGLAHWRPGPLAEADEERRVWRYIATLVSDPLPVHLGLGREDRFAGRHRLLASALGPERVDVVPGGHDWPTWVRLWERFLDTRLASHPKLAPGDH